MRVIEVGQTRLQFKQLGLPTQRLGAPRGGARRSRSRTPAVRPRLRHHRRLRHRRLARKLNPYATGYMPEAPSDAKKPPSNPYLTQKVDED